MANEPRRRLTEARVADIYAEIGALEVRIAKLERRVDGGTVLAEEIGLATLRTLRRHQADQRKPSRGET